MIKCLDKGYVRLVDKMGNDLSVVNSARVSYDKSTDEMREQDIRLINFLQREGHNSPFRHAVLKFEVYAPLFVKNQWWKHVVGTSHQDPMLAWNESSRRYVTEEPKFYLPEPWLSAPENKKQGSDGPIKDEELNNMLSLALAYQQEYGTQLYNDAIKHGVAPEQARLFLPAYGLYVRWHWTASLYGVIHFIKLRKHLDAQHEIQVYADAVMQYAWEHFPESIKAYFKEEVGKKHEKIQKQEWLFSE